MAYHTADSGFTWEEQGAVANVSLFGLSFPNTLHGWASGEKAPSCISRSGNKAPLSQLAQPGLQDSECGNGGSFGSQDSGP
jgi:hypothetical protein